ncbi:MAG: hypothetical protein DIU68_019410 [Chloroflexota bacterium]|nr:MAG: hypothetical protein DIU68_13860 [Chloroflexota bacterium]
MATIRSNGLQVILGPEGFVTEVHENGVWQPASRAPSRPVDALAVGATHADGYSGNGAGYRWRSTFESRAGGILVRTRLEAERPVSLDPSMVLWVAALDEMDDRQAHTWRQTVLRAPTVNATGLSGNDLPAGYLYDHTTRTETICFFPPDGLAWAERRFCEWALREVFRYHPDARFGIGLLPGTPRQMVELAPGEYVFEWWFTQRARHDVPNPWQAQRALIEAVAPLLDPAPAVLPNAVSWTEAARGAEADLLNEACWVTVNNVTGLRAYVKGSSVVGRDHDRGFELMTQLDVLHPLLVQARLSGHPSPEPVVERLLATLPEFDRAAHHFVANGFPPRPGDTHMDTWYFLENALVKLPWVAHLTGSEQLLAMFRRSLEGAKLLAERCNYVFPLFADALDWQARGSLLNPSVGGLYAAGCVLGWQLTGDRQWLHEAARALETLYRLPPHLLTHEPQQLSFGAAAARFLAKAAPDVVAGDDWDGMAADLVRLSLRMGYWGRDPGAPFYDPRGMFQACASLAYPAFKENVETLWPWPELLRHGAESAGDGDAFNPQLVELMCAFANLARCHNLAFFDPYLPEQLRRGPCPWIPYEDIATTEFPHTAALGKELYGAGEVFWSALLFDALGRCDAPDVLMLSLDVPALDLSMIPGAVTQPGSREEWRYLLYNPADADRRVTVTTPLGDREVTLEPRHCFYLTISN